MHPPTRFIATLALAASCVAASGQLPVPPATPPPSPPPRALSPLLGTEQERPDSATTSSSTESPEGPAPTEAQLKKLTEQLGSDDFKNRETAQIELSALARQHPAETLDRLLAEYLKSSVPEARYRLRSILYTTKQDEYMKIPRGFVGIVMYPSFARGADGQVIHAVQVRSVVADSAADRHGLQVADQIISIDGKTFSAADPLEDFAGYVTGKRRGDEVELVLLRQAQEQTIKLKLGQRPPDLLGQDYRAQERFDRDFKNWLDDSSERLRAEP